jgi:hypothetical protein
MWYKKLACQRPLFTKKEPRKSLYHHHGQWHCDWVQKTGKSASIVDQGRDFTVVMVNRGISWVHETGM